VPSSYTLKFDAPGTYLYTNPFPPVDTGIVTVVPAPTPSP
jgi:hypothetical protein